MLDGRKKEASSRTTPPTSKTSGIAARQPSVGLALFAIFRRDLVIADIDHSGEGERVDVVGEVIDVAIEVGSVHAAEMHASRRGGDISRDPERPLPGDAGHAFELC